MPTNVVKAQEKTGSQTSGESSGSDDMALKVSRDNARPLALARAGNAPAVRNSGQDNTSDSDGDDDAVLSEILGSAPDIFKDTIQELTDESSQAMRMHHHYNDQAVNGTDIEMSTGAEDAAASYLNIAIKASNVKADLIKTMISTMGKGNKAKKAKKSSSDSQGPMINVADGGSVAIHFTSRREALMAARESGGGNHGKLTAEAVVLDADPIDDVATQDNNGNDDKEPTDDSHGK